MAVPSEQPSSVRRHASSLTPNGVPEAEQAPDKQVLGGEGRAGGRIDLVEAEGATAQTRCSRGPRSGCSPNPTPGATLFPGIHMTLRVTLVSGTVSGTPSPQHALVYGRSPAILWWSTQHLNPARRTWPRLLVRRGSTVWNSLEEASLSSVTEIFQTSQASEGTPGWATPSPRQSKMSLDYSRFSTDLPVQVRTLCVRSNHMPLWRAGWGQGQACFLVQFLGGCPVHHYYRPSLYCL